MVTHIRQQRCWADDNSHMALTDEGFIRSRAEMFTVCNNTVSRLGKISKCAS